ncbi:Merozoite surface protein P92 [Bienertia sinuspersici]
MMLGKRGRQRPPMKRNTSMTEFSYDDLSLVIPSPSAASDSDQSNPSSDQNNKVTGFMCPIPRSLNRRNSGDFVLESNGTFLRTCSLCSRRLAPTRDIYMYRYVFFTIIYFSLT